MTLILPRRRFLAGLVGIIATPAIVRAETLMKVASTPPAKVGQIVWTLVPDWETGSVLQYRLVALTGGVVFDTDCLITAVDPGRATVTLSAEPVVFRSLEGGEAQP